MLSPARLDRASRAEGSAPPTWERGTRSSLFHPPTTPCDTTPRAVLRAVVMLAHDRAPVTHTCHAYRDPTFKRQRRRVRAVAV